MLTSSAGLIPALTPLLPAQATGLGQVDIEIGSGKEAVTRPIFFARYIDWSITTPLLLVDVLLMARLPIVVAGWAIFADLAMVVTGLIGGLDGSEYRCGTPCYSISCKLKQLLPRWTERYPYHRHRFVTAKHETHVRRMHTSQGHCSSAQGLVVHPYRQVHALLDIHRWGPAIGQPPLNRHDDT